MISRVLRVRAQVITMQEFLSENDEIPEPSDYYGEYFLFCFRAIEIVARNQESDLGYLDQLEKQLFVLAVFS